MAEVFRAGLYHGKAQHKQLSKQRTGFCSIAYPDQVTRMNDTSNKHTLKAAFSPGGLTRTMT